MNTKESISKAALLLFNKNGVEKVTTRDIAREAGISQGNLHYHYSNKELLIETLFEKFLKKVDELSSFTMDKPFGKEDVLKSMQENYRLMHRFRFLFVESSAVWRSAPTVRKGTEELLERKRKDFLGLIAYYQKQGVLREDLSTHQLESLSDQFVFTICSWLTAKDFLHQPIGYFVQYTFRLWIPYLQIDEMKAWEDVLLEQRIQQ